MLYKCEKCTYNTNDCSNWHKHIKSKKHLKNYPQMGIKVSNVANRNIKKSIKTTHQCSLNATLQSSKQEKNISKIKCTYCDKEFNRTFNLTRHLNICPYRKVQENNKDSKYEKMAIELQLYKEKIDMVIKENERLQKTIDNSGYVSKKSVSALNFIVEKYNDAPALRKIKDSDYKKLDTPKDDSLEVTFIRQYNIKQLASYLGGFIIGMYYKQDPEEQSVWTSDTSRLTYIIKQLLSNGDSKWITDKRGVKFTEIVIKPLLDFVDRVIKAYTPDMLEQVEKSRPVWSYEVIAEYQAARIKLLMAIDDHTLENDILKHTAPYLFIDRSESSNKELIDYNKKKYKS